MLYDTTWRPRTLLDWLKGYRYTPKCHINVADCFNHVGIPRTVPSQPCCYLKGFPQIRVRIYKNSDTKPTNVKQTKQSIESKGDLNPKVTPLLSCPQQSRQFCDTVGELTSVLRSYSHLCGWARVATDFLFYPKGKVKKAQQKPFEIFRGFGG